MSVYQSVSTNLSSTAFILMPRFLNGMKVDSPLSRQLGAKKRTMFSVGLVSQSTVYLLYKEKEKEGGKRVAGRVWGTKVDGGHNASGCSA